MLKSSFKIVFLFTITIVLSMPLTGCFDSREVNELAYVMALGVDKGKSGNILLTVQIAVPSKIGDGGSESSGGGKGGGDESSLIESVQTPSLWAGLNMLNAFTSRELNLTHAKAFVVSEDVAKEGLGKYLHTLVRNRQIRPNMYVVISRTSAQDYIKSVTPKLELNTSKYYELNFRSGSYTAFIPDSIFSNFYYATEAYDRQAIAILASVNKFSKDKPPDIEASTYTQKNRSVPLEGDFKAGDIPRLGDLKSEAMGSAVFNGNKMVGELDGEETAFYLLASGKYNRAYWTIPDPKFPGYYVIYNVRQNRFPRIKIQMINNTPVINLKLNLEADIQAIQSEENYERPDDIKILENAAKNFISQGITKTFEKCARQYHSDVFGFGKYARGLVLTWNQWQQLDWLSKFPSSKLNVDTEFNIRRTGLIIRPVPEISSK